MNSSYIQVLLGGTHKVKCQTHASLVQSLAAPRKPAGTKTVARSSSQCPFQRLTPRSLLGVGCVTSSRPALTGDRDQGYLADTVRGGAAQAAIFEACVGDSNVGVAERPSILSRGGCCCWEVRRAEWWLESIYLRVEVGLVLLLLFQLKEGLQ